MMMASGAAVVLRRKFSATHFMSDIRHYRCTVFQVRGRPESFPRMHIWFT